MLHNELKQKNWRLPFVIFEAWWEVIRFGLIWMTLAGLVVLVYMALFSLLDWFRVLSFEQASRDSAVFLATLLTLLLLRSLRLGSQSLVDNLFFADTANFKDEVDTACRILADINDREHLWQFMVNDLPSRLKVDGLYLHHYPQSLIRHSITLPLNRGSHSLGYLTIGPKYSGRSFSYEERTILKQLQEQVSLVLSGIQLAEAREEAERVAQLKSNFLTNISHELRTPLNAVINSTGLVADGILGDIGEVPAEYLNRAVEGSEYLMKLLNDILDLTKIESGQLTLRFDEMDLKEVIADTLPIIKATLQDKPVELKLEIAGDLPLLAADRLRVRQVLLNLLSNAAKFTKEGSILVKAWRERNLVLVSVKDTGIGIAPEDQRLIFEDYQQVSAGRHHDFAFERRRHAGTGLGMSITKALIELHRGQIWVESELGKGATFTFTLPVNLNSHKNGNKSLSTT
jgi:signal transduction histidine kinase